VRAGTLLVLVTVAAACAGPAADQPAEAPVAAVPGVTTAPADTKRVRDVVQAFGTVAAEAEPTEVRDARTALADAEARRRLAAQQVQRLERLAGAVAPQKELDAARAEEAAATAAATRARNVLGGFGTDAAGGALDPGEHWVIARVMEVDVGRVERGGDVRFEADAYPGATFTGRVDAPPSYVDPASHTAPVRLRVRDGDARLRPGMTGDVELEIGAPRDAVVVPAAAVVYDDAQSLVFVEADGRYEARPVNVGLVRDGWIEIAAGVSAGTPVVVTGAASLLSASRLPAVEAE
jgi:Barrel-sandwich domain of CusB or HlyD membrane-fusion